MRASVVHGLKDIRSEEVPDPTLVHPTDAIVKVAAACVCGSDLWSYRGVNGVPVGKHIGHEFVGTVTEVGDSVTGLAVGDFVISPFSGSCGACVNCRNGIFTSCDDVVWWGGTNRDGTTNDGAQGEYVRVPFADATLVRAPEPTTEEGLKDLLTLSDVFGTGHHAAVSAGVGPGTTVAVVGDGAVGLSAVLAAKRLGARRVIALSTHAPRQAVAREFGADEILPLRGDDAVAAVRELTRGVGADVVLECVGTQESMDQAIASTRPGGAVGFVGLPAGGSTIAVRALFSNNVRVTGGVAPVRAYIPELIQDVVEGRIHPGRVFDSVMPLADVGAAYTAMDERRAIKVMLLP